jgi:hypothetical protein
VGNYFSNIYYFIHYNKSLKIPNGAGATRIRKLKIPKGAGATRIRKSKRKKKNPSEYLKGKISAYIEKKPNSIFLSICWI